MFTYKLFLCVYTLYRSGIEFSDIHSDPPCTHTLSSQFPVFVDYEDVEDPSTLISLHIRSWLVSERVLSALTEALAGCPQLKILK